MERLLVAGVLVVVAVVIAVVLQRRQGSDPPTQQRWDVPTQLDRADFPAGGEHPWLVVVFTSSSCDSCAKVVPKAEVLRSEQVAVVEVPWQSERELHERYAIDVVPMTLVADEEGVVRASFIGQPSATDLWAAVAEVREPGSSPEGLERLEGLEGDD